MVTVAAGGVSMIPDEQGYQGPDKLWQWCGYKLGHHRRTDVAPSWWEFTGADGLGSSASNPFKAFLDWRRWRKEYAARPWYKQW